MTVSHNVDLELEFDAIRPYQPGDTIEGVAHAKFNDDIRVQDIQVSIHGTSYTRVEESNGNKNTTVYSETHVLLYDVLTVFPPPSFEEAMTSKEYTINAGDTISHPFQFKLPLNAFCSDREEVEQTNLATSKREERFTREKVNYTGSHLEKNSLPHSFERNAYDIRGVVAYELKLSVHKASTFSMNSHASFSFQVQNSPLVKSTPVYTQVITSEPITVKKKRLEQGSSKGWFSKHVANRPEKIPITFRTIALFPDFFHIGTAFKPLVYIVTDMEPETFTEESHNEKKSHKLNEKSDALNPTGLGEIWLTKNKFSLYGRMDLQASRKRESVVDHTPGSVLIQSEKPQGIDLAQLLPVSQLGSLVLQQCCQEKYALDVSHLFQDGVIPEIEPTMSICNIQYGHWLELRMSWAGKSDASAFSRKSITLSEKTLVMDCA